jgi:hypothetical protein
VALGIRGALFMRLVSLALDPEHATLIAASCHEIKENIPNGNCGTVYALAFSNAMLT